MSNFVIQCPKCGQYAEAKTGFFARKRIDCSCGNVIDVRTDRMVSRACAHCGNAVVFDASEGSNALCPVCHSPINTVDEQTKTAEFSCKQCGVRLKAVRSAASYVCPVCDYENDVAQRLMQEEIRQDGLASIIKYEGDNETLVWKHPIEDFNYGSQLIVHESQEAVFYKDGQALDLFGAGRYTLETQQLPLLEKMYKLPTDTEGTFHSEVYFINLTTQMGIKWGTDTKVRLFDPGSGLHIEIGAGGEFSVRVTDSRRLLLKLIGTAGSMTQGELLRSDKNYFRAMIMTQVKSYLPQAIRESGMSVLEIDERLLELSEALRERINRYLVGYGLEMPEFFISRIVTPDDDPNYKRLKQQFADQYLLVREEQIRKKEAEAAAQRKAVEAETEARLKVIGAGGEAEALKVKKAAEAEAYRMQAEAEAAEMRMKGYTYQQETARKVGMEAMQNGIGGDGAGGGLGDLAGLGVTLGAMGGVINMTKDAMSPIMDSATEIGKGVLPDTGWNCACGTPNITSNFCPNCGSKKPEASVGWHCACGTQNITTSFCPNCGKKRGE